MLELYLSGSPSEMGSQHAEQVAVVCDQVTAAVDAFLATIDLAHASSVDRVEAAGRFLKVSAPRTWDMYRATVEGMDLDWYAMQAYALRSFLGRSGDGCTVVADGRGTSLGTGPVLAKTRDYHSEHIGIQMLARVQPNVGYSYAFLGSAGSPGVFSSGMNEQGLAVADTHVPSSDLGIGLPRYALMLDLLERCQDVASGIAYLESVVHMGGGTIVLCDRQGRVAVCESSHRQPVVWAGHDGWVISTNHFTDPGLVGSWEGSQPDGVSSRGRHETARRQIASVQALTPGGAIELLADHDGSASICRHGEEGDDSSTILGVVFQPDSLTMRVGVGNPCIAEWRTELLQT